MTRGARLLDVTAYTTLDFVDATVEGRDWETDAVGVLNVDAREDPATEEPEAVTLALEVDDSDVEDLPQHAVTIELSAADARAVADELTDRAAAVDGGA